MKTLELFGIIISIYIILIIIIVRKSKNLKIQQEKQQKKQKEKQQQERLKEERLKEEEKWFRVIAFNTSYKNPITDEERSNFVNNEIEIYKKIFKKIFENDPNIIIDSNLSADILENTDKYSYLNDDEYEPIINYIGAKEGLQEDYDKIKQYILDKLKEKRDIKDITLGEVIMGALENNEVRKGVSHNDIEGHAKVKGRNPDAYINASKEIFELAKEEVLKEQSKPTIGGFIKFIKKINKKNKQNRKSKNNNKSKNIKSKKTNKK